MSKKKLRPANIIASNGFAIRSRVYFHKWIIRKDKLGNETPMGLIETEKGELFLYNYMEIKFLDKPSIDN